MTDAQAAHHQFDRLGKLFLDHRQTLLGLPVHPDVDRAHAHDDAKRDLHRRGCLCPDLEPEERDDRQHDHDHDQRLGRESDVGLLRLRREDGVKGNALGFQVLAGFLAQLFQNLFALPAFLQKGKPAVHLVVERDRLAEEQQVDAFDKEQDGDEDQGVDDRGRA